MSNEAMFMQAILTNPESDAERLIYADYLDERSGTVACPICRDYGKTAGCRRCHDSGRVPDGNAGRAEFIRVQCALGRGECRCTMTRGLHPCRLHLRERALWAKIHRDFDIPGVVPGSPMILFDDEPSLLIRGDQVVRLYPVRGFVGRVECGWQTWCGEDCGCTQGGSPVSRQDCPACEGKGRVNALGPLIVAAAPVTSVVLTDREPTEVDGEWLWWAEDHSALGLLSPSALPRCLLADWQWRHRTRTAALAALSAAALAWARSVKPVT